MARTKEEIAADLVWQYVEHVRQSEAEGRPACFSRTELDQLVDVLETAAGMPHALTADECEERRAAVRRRVEQMLPSPAASAAPPPQAVPEASAPRRSWLQDFLGGAAVVPAWRFQAATAAALALTCAVVTVNFWHRPAPEVRVVERRSEAPGDVEPISEQTAHELLPGMVRNRLARQEERNLMWHMLVCPRCYDEYAAMKERERTAFRPGAGVRLISYR